MADIRSQISSSKRIWMITDTHLGVRNGSVEWLEIMKEYFYEFFIPLLERESKPGDMLVHVGDVFDSRHSLNLLVMNEGMEIFEKISRIMPIAIILGNHDIYRKLTNDVNSVKILKWIPNILVLEEPEVIRISGKRVLFMPWRSSVEEERKCVESNPADILFCHTDVKGLRFNRNTVIEEGMDLKAVSSFSRVYAGHIHYSQHKGNFRMLGCPYPMTRSDVGNPKGIWMLDLESDKETFFENTHSPKFIRVSFEKILDMEEEEVIGMFRNNFVDVMIDPKWTLSFPFSVFTEDMKGYRKLEFIPRMNSEEEEDVQEGEGGGKIDILEIAAKVVESTSHSDTLKGKLMSTIRNLYERVQKAQEEEVEN